MCYTRRMAKKKPMSETAEILEIVNFIKDYMVENMMTKEEGATKAGMAAGFLRLEERLLSIEQELKEIKRRLSGLEKEIGGVDSVTVHWVGGVTESFTGVGADGRWRLVEGAGVAR